MVRSIKPNSPIESEETGAGAEADRIDRWGRRIGRMLGWMVAALLLFYLLRSYGP
jgi:hypothetical protein